MSEGPAGQSEASQGAARNDDDERNERIHSLCERLRAELKEMDDLGLRLPAALLDNALAEIEKHRTPDFK